MGYRVDPNAKNVWVRDNADTMDLSVQTEANAVYLENGRTLEQEVGKGTMVSNVVTVDGSMEKVVEGTYDGVYESCKMYGRSLVNLISGGNEQRQVGKSNATLAKYNYVYQLDHTKTYTIFFEVSGFVGTNPFAVSMSTGDDGCGAIAQDGAYKIKFTPRSYHEGRLIGVWFFWETGKWSDENQAFVKNVVVLEGDYTNQDLPFINQFEGLCDVKMPILKNVGRNLLRISDYNELRMGATLISKTENSVTWRNPTAWGGPVFRLYLKPNTTYSYAFDKGATDIRGYVRYLENGGYTGGFGGNDQQTFTTRADGHVMFTIECPSVQDSVTVSNLIFVEEEVIPTFEPHKTNILETSNEVILRGLPNGVRDTYDCLTGEYIRRVEERDYQESDESDSNVITDLVKTHYKLAEPTITMIEPSTTPFAYENGHIILESGHEGQSLLPTLEYQTVVSRSGQVAMIDKTIQQHECKITLLEKMLVQNIIDIEYKNTLLALKLEIDEVI